MSTSDACSGSRTVNNNNNKNCSRRTTSNRMNVDEKKIIFHYRMVLPQWWRWWRWWLVCVLRNNGNRISIWSPLHKPTHAHVYFAQKFITIFRVHRIFICRIKLARNDRDVHDSLHTWLKPKTIINKTRKLIMNGKWTNPTESSESFLIQQCAATSMLQILLDSNCCCSRVAVEMHSMKSRNGSADAENTYSANICAIVCPAEE